MSNEVTFNPNQVQRQFIESQAKSDLFSSRMGEGKSAGLCWTVMYHTRHNPGARWAVIRDTWENLRDTTLKEFFKWFPPGVFGTWNESKKTYTWAPGIADGEINWLGMDDPGDASKLQSRELGGFAIDEPAPAAQSGGVAELVFDIAMSRLRQPGMKWYASKLATNNPDETHWTYSRFVDPGTEGFRVWQPVIPENERNLPPAYYNDLRKIWTHRPDLIARFVDGKYGMMHEGKVVTPQWNDLLHLAVGLGPVRGPELVLLWDFGLNPTCIITQVTPLGYWNVLEARVGQDIGVEELIEHEIKPLLAVKYKGFRWRHIGDNQGRQKEQSSSQRSAVRSVQQKLGGPWRSGPIPTLERIEPLRAILTRTINGKGLVQVDRVNAKPVWQALRGGWHYHVAKTGVPGQDPVKDIHSHPGDAMGYGASILFPMGKMQTQRGSIKEPAHAIFFGQGRGLTFGPGGARLPADAKIIGR